jgi:hypothetical protein
MITNKLVPKLPSGSLLYYFYFCYQYAWKQILSENSFVEIKTYLTT